MKSVYLCLMVLCATIAVTGCGAPEDNALATDSATADDFAKYEEELAAVSGDDSYEEEEAGDDAAE